MVGAMRDRILIKEPVNTPVSGGGHVTTWEEVTEVWCKAEPYKSVFGLHDSEQLLQDTLKFTIRYIETLQPTWLIEYRGKDYTIGSIKDIQQRDRFQEIVAITNNDNSVPITT